MRMIEVYDSKNGFWLEMPFADLQSNDVFRIFDKGERYMDDDGNTVWIATSKPYKNADDVLTINTLY